MDVQSALVTGASSGIGAAFARALPAGTDLLLTGRDAERLSALEAELRAAGDAGRRVETLSADLRRDDGREAVIRHAEAMGVDLLVNNAGTGRFAAVLENDLDDERATVEVNVLAPVLLTRALLPGMLNRARREHRRAGLINVASGLAFQPWPYLATYAASKSFVLAYTEALAAELRCEPIAVLALCPGPTRTPFSRRAGYSGSVPGVAEPADVAREGLQALGRRTVHVCGGAARTALTPFLLPRRLVTDGLGLAMSLLGRQPRGRGSVR